MGFAILPGGNGDMTKVVYDSDGNGVADDVDNVNGVPAATITTDLANATAASHSHANKAQLDLVTDGDHDVRTDNPHSVTAAQAGAEPSGSIATHAGDASAHHTRYADSEAVAAVLAADAALLPVTAGNTQNNTDVYLRCSGRVLSNNAGYVLAHDYTIVGIGLATNNAETWTAEVRKNDNVAVIASLASGGAAKAATAALSVDVDADDELQFYCNGTLINNPSMITYLKRR